MLTRGGAAVAAVVHWFDIVVQVVKVSGRL